MKREMQMFFNYLTPMTIKDCGKPYDPVSNGFTAEACGALSASYRFMFAMNVTTIKWPKI